MPETCLWCDRLAVRYCDAPIGCKAVDCYRDKGDVRLVTGRDEQGEWVIWTCDAPLCLMHTKQVGHVCGRGNVHDSIDRCPYHADNKQKPLREMIMFPREVERRRAEIWAEIRRSQLKVTTE